MIFIIPALNESTTIADVVNRTRSHGDVLVIDDGSTDGTGDIAKSQGALVYRNEVPNGYEQAIMQGLNIANDRGYEFVVTLDADGQHDPREAKILAGLLSSGYDIVTTERPYRPRFSEWLFSAVSYRLWGIPDPLSGMKGYSVRFIAQHGLLQGANLAGAELAVKAKLHFRGTHACVPISIKERNDKSRYGGHIVANLKILRALSKLLVRMAAYTSR